MKIVIASGTYPPEIGGMATFVKNFAQAFTAAGHSVKVLAYGEADAFIAQPFEVRFVARGRFTPVRYWRYFWALKDMLADADLIYGQDLVSSGFPAALASLHSGKPLVVRIGGDFLWERQVEKGATHVTLREYYSHSKSLTEKIYLNIYRFVLSRSRRVIFNNSYQPEIYKNFFAQELPATKVATVYNPWPGRTSTSVNPNGILLYWGRILALKNLKALLALAERGRLKRKLVILGAGPQEVELKKIVAEKQLGGKVEFRPVIAREKIPELLTEARLHIIPSLTDLNPHTAMEALASGVPILITQENGLPEEVKSQLITFDPKSEEDLADKLDFLENPENYRAYVQRLSTIKFDQNWDKVISQHLEIFSQIIRPLAE
jgi:glycosyltransferase involved in cell wall biosynthesis